MIGPRQKFFALTPIEVIVLLVLVMNSAWAQPVLTDPRPIVLAFGDSLTSGYGAGPGFGYPEQLQKKLDASGYRYRVVNLGVPGDNTKAALTQINGALALKPAIVIVELGSNDRLSMTFAETGVNLEEIVRRFRDAGTTVVLAQVDADLSEVFERLVDKYAVTLIPALLEGVEHNDKLMTDRLHPNAEGYAVVTRTVMASIEPLLKRSSSSSGPDSGDGTE